MRCTVCIVVASLALALIGATAVASTYSIPKEKVDVQKVYYGTATGFEKAAQVSYEQVIKATPEYTEVKTKKIEPGTGRYWILLSQASERAVRAISQVGQETGYDFIAAQAYLGSLEPSIPAEDITSIVLDRVKDETKTKSEISFRDNDKKSDVKSKKSSSRAPSAR